MCDSVCVYVCFLGRGRGLEEEDIIDNFVVPAGVLTHSTVLREGRGQKMYFHKYTHTPYKHTETVSYTNVHRLPQWGIH